ncbi:alpha-amylase [Carnobacterium iners]|uniref:Alpha-amylase n=1 Tax=Carnobacterium iners TaxID=1073423 RepID=A0A1X7MRE4_9LACT|nr:alpha-amylase [Carnobacterium iners]SEK74756.1 alpha-amylase [Carnobacterium iners]SMH27419.1 alpha-amylase [Carnobacterium iners]
MENGVMMQYFEWFVADDGKHWQRLKDDAKHLSEIGVTSVWIPPCFKATGTNDVGYGIYDLYDLGEFKQKEVIRTKYGVKQELKAAIDELHKYDIQVYADIVLNHKAGADETEKFLAIEVDPDDRNKIVSDAYEITGWTKFTYPGRKNTYSKFKWSWEHFTGIDYNQANGKEAIYLIQGENKSWADDSKVNDEHGNYDYLMYADIDYSHPDVIEETKNWAKWFVEETGVDGFRLDAIKHINEDFIFDLVKTIRNKFGEQFYIVGEYWGNDYDEMENYLEAGDFNLDLVDVSLHTNFEQASKSGNDYDLRKLFDETLMQKNDPHSVTFVDNHDSQPGQSLESFVEPWFKPMAYGSILLREKGYPCIFYGDYYGIQGDNPIEPQRETIDQLLYIRANYAYGEQVDYLDHANCIGWTRFGNEDNPHGCAVILSNSEKGYKNMYVGEEQSGEIFVDYLKNSQDFVTIDENGWGQFIVEAGSLSVWVKKNTE